MQDRWINKDVQRQDIKSTCPRSYTAILIALTYSEKLKFLDLAKGKREEWGP